MAVPDYDPDRLRKTWREKHGWSDKAEERRDKTRNSHKRNRKVALVGKINWDSYQHDQLYDMIMSASPQAMVKQSDNWRDLAKAIEKTTDDVQTELKKLMDSWHGAAAVNASGATTNLMRWAGDASHTATQIAAGIANYTDAVSLAQRKMPEPGFADAERNFRDGYTVVGTGGPSTAVLLQQLLSDQLVSHKQAADRKAEAVEVMNNYESSSKQVHHDLPDDFAPAPQTTNQNVAPDESPDLSPIPPVGHPGPGDNPRPPVGGGVAGDLDGDGIVDSTTPDSFVPSSTAPGPGLSTTGGLPGGGGGGLGAGGIGGFGGGAGGAGSGGPLAARGGAMNPGAAGLAGGRGAGGMGGAGGFFPGMAGAGTQGDGDGEHTNKYDEGLDLFDDLPPAYPPVFGA